VVNVNTELVKKHYLLFQKHYLLFQLMHTIIKS